MTHTDRPAATTPRLAPRHHHTTAVPADITFAMVANRVSHHSANAGAPLAVTIRAEFVNDADADAVAAMFSKSLRIRRGQLGYGGPDAPVVATVILDVSLASNGNNGGVDETGIKRYRSFRRTAERAGMTVVYGRRGAGSSTDYASEVEFHAAIGVE